jgi:hypothetical protein
MWCGDFPIKGVQDNAINMKDVMQIAAYFNTKAGDGKYDALYDINYDTAINLTDIMALVAHFLKIQSDYPAVTLT